MSPDGSRVVVMIRKGGKGQLILVSADGSESRTLAGSIDAQGAADWAPDGSAIVTGGSDEQGLGLFRLPIDGGTPARLAKGLAVNPVWSPDGSLIVYAGTSVARSPAARGCATRWHTCRVAGDTGRARQPRAPISAEREGPRVSANPSGSCGGGRVHRRLATGSRHQDEEAPGALDRSVRDSELRYHSRWKAHYLRPRERQLRHRLDRHTTVGAKRRRPSVRPGRTGSSCHSVGRTSQSLHVNPVRTRALWLTPDRAARSPLTSSSFFCRLHRLICRSRFSASCFELCLSA